MNSEGQSAIPFIPQPEEDSRVPAQVDVAFEVVRWGNGIEAPQIDHVEARELISKERAVYESGLEVLRLYLTGEMTFVEPREQEPVVSEKLSSENVKTTS